MKQYEVFELSFRGEAPAGSQAIVDVRGQFSCNGSTKEVEGFYAGNGIYKVRFFPEEAGEWEWKVSGIVEGEGKEVCEKADPGRHGIVRADKLHFKYEDGTKFLPFGTTVYALVHQDKALVDTTMETLSHAPFNKVRMCVFPKHYDFNHNEPDYFAFEKTEGKFDVNRPCFAFWDAFEARLKELDAMGIQADLILFHPYDRWGFSEFTKEECLTYLDYLLRRLSTIPNLWWSLANEFDLMGHFGRDWWAEFASFIAKHDAYGHLLSNHNCFGYWDFANENTTHCCIQDTCVDEVPSLQKKYGKPVVFDEVCYEGNIIHPWGNISGFEMANRFWTAVVCGGYCTHGETFLSEDEILWWARGGKLKGQSPARISFLKQIAESLPGSIEYFGGEHPFPSVEEIAAQREKMKAEQGENVFMQGLLQLPEARLGTFISRHKPIMGRCGDEAFIRYYRNQCTCVGELELPDTGSYQVEVIDIWEMTRKVAATGVNGKIKVDLPGKEGIAILATKER